MKATISRETFANAVKLVLPCVGHDNVKPELKCAKLVVDGLGCTLMSSNLEMGVRLDFQPLAVDAPGETLLPATKVSQILAEANDDKVELSVDKDDVVSLSSGYGSWDMEAPDVAGFPDVSAFADGEPHHEMPAGLIEELIGRTIFATARGAGDQRFAMSGVLWEFINGEAILVGTDAKRLAIARGKATSRDAKDTGFASHIVPTKAVRVLQGLWSGPEEAVRVALRPNEALFRTERATFSARLIEGNYPTYRSVIPKTIDAIIGLKAGPVAQAARQSSIMTHRGEYTFKPSRLEVRAADRDAGKANVAVTPIEYDGKPFKILFDTKHLLDMLNAVGPDAQVQLHSGDPAGAQLFKIGDAYEYVMMPLAG